MLVELLNNEHGVEQVVVARVVLDAIGTEWIPALLLGIKRAFFELKGDWSLGRVLLAEGSHCPYEPKDASVELLFEDDIENDEHNQQPLNHHSKPLIDKMRHDLSH